MIDRSDRGTGIVIISIAENIIMTPLKQQENIEGLSMPPDETPGSVNALISSYTVLEGPRNEV